MSSSKKTDICFFFFSSSFFFFAEGRGLFVGLFFREKLTWIVRQNPWCINTHTHIYVYKCMGWLRLPGLKVGALAACWASSLHLAINQYIWSNTQLPTQWVTLTLTTPPPSPPSHSPQLNHNAAIWLADAGLFKECGGRGRGGLWQSSLR